MSFTTAEIEQLRAETSGTQHVLHFNNAGASLMPDVVRDAMINYLHQEARYGSYETERAFEAQLAHTYQAVAALLNAEVSEIALVDNATIAWQRAFYSLPFQKGDIILTSQAAYITNHLNYLKVRKNIGVHVQVVPSDAHGQIDVRALENHITPDVKLIALTYIPTNNALINPARAVGQVANYYGIPYLLDACQAVGQIPVDVKEIGCDFLSASGRKYLRAPRNTGFLYVKQSWLDNGIEPPAINSHSANWTSKDAYQMHPTAQRFEHGERSLAANYGLGMAIDYALSVGIERSSVRLSQLAAQLREALVELPNVSVHDIGKRKGGIVSFAVDGYSNQDIMAYLARHNMNVTCISHKKTWLFTNADQRKDNLVRASVHYYNTNEEIERFVHALGDL